MLPLQQAWGEKHIGFAACPSGQADSRRRQRERWRGGGALRLAAAIDRHSRLRSTLKPTSQMEQQRESWRSTYPVLDGVRPLDAPDLK